MVQFVVSTSSNSPDSVPNTALTVSIIVSADTLYAEISRGISFELSMSESIRKNLLDDKISTSPVGNDNERVAKRVPVILGNFADSG